ncbi:MAG: prolipoprotein diacylglyceryl transferase [Phycisphaerales bacterium]|nr:MAG: prolipoprotein diacylglyceryl transferase [Phycisphaerales bacterium]
MWPRIGPIPTYSIFYSVGILIHFFVSYLIARRLGLRHRVWIVVSICYMEGMTVGAKVLYDLQQGQFDISALLTIEHHLKGGLWGGLLVYFALAVPLAYLLARRRLAGLDLVALSLPGPLILAKLGCLFKGCCYGRPSSVPWAITFGEGAEGAPAGVPVHPTQIYEILVIVCVVVVFGLLEGQRWRGTMLLWFLIVYGFGRATTELWRGDVTGHVCFGRLTLSQLVCLLAAAVSGFALYFRHGVCAPGPPSARV